MTDSIHGAYVQSLLNGSGLARHKGKMVRFHTVDGAGFGDWVKGLWGKAKSAVSKVIPTIVDVGKSAAVQGLSSALNQQGSIKDRLRAGFQGAKGSILDRKDELLDAGRDAAMGML